MAKLSLDIWSDIACPWCYIGKRRIEQALARFAHREDVAVAWRAFELDPSAPRVRDAAESHAEMIAKKYRVPTAQAQQMIDRVVDTAAQDGLDFHFERIRPGNTFDAHRVIHLARERGKQDAVKERMMRGYLTEGRAIGEPEVIAELARDAGLDEAEVREVLGSDRYAREVRADEALARELGISGVPFFVLGGRLGVSGAQPAEVLLGALERAWADRPQLESYAEGAACGPEGCD